MKVYTCNIFTKRHLPTAAAVVAESQTQAAAILNSALLRAGIPSEAQPLDMIELPTNTTAARVIYDGNY